MKHILHFVKLYKQEVFIIILSIITILVFIPIFTYLYFVSDLSSKDAIMNRNSTGVILEDRTGKPFFTFYSAHPKDFVPLSDIAENAQHAIIASEDKDFYHHPGFSIRGILRSMYLDILNRDTAFGGSTITQQLVKNALLSPEKSFLRKYQELFLSQEIERRYSKNEILEMYLNSVYFGEGAFGIEDAAMTYFGKHASQLTLAESSMLAGILPSPSALSPISGDKNAAKQHQEIVLQKMVEQGYISNEQKQQAENTELSFTNAKQDINSEAPHFALMVRDELIKEYGEQRISRSGFKVRTTLDLSDQDAAENAVSNQVARLAGDNATNGAAVVIDPKNGEILALVGSKDWFNEGFGKVNMAITPRSPGSSFKPIIYSAAFEKMLISPATILKDEPTTFAGGYKPLDYDRKFRGDVTVRRALANSLNIPAVEVMDMVGIPDGLDMAKRLGITTLKSPSDYGLSLVLGTGEVKLTELTNVYATFANEGTQYPITTILEIDDKNGQKIYNYTPTPQQVISPEVSFLITSILSDNVARAEEFGSALTISRPAAVKTGTAEDYRDALTLGYTPSLAVGVWVGNNDNTPMDQIAGSLGAAPIWRSLMETILQGTPIEKFQKPPTIVSAYICRNNGLLLHNSTATSSALLEYFLPGTEPRQYCDSDHSQPPTPQPTTQDQNLTPSPTQQQQQSPTNTPTPTVAEPTPTITLLPLSITPFFNVPGPQKKK